MIGAQINGLASLRDKVGNLPGLVRTPMASELNKIADELVVKQKAEAPVRSGKGRDHIRKKPGKSDLEVKVVAADEATEYMFYDEVGTVKEPAHPFFFPPYREMKPSIPGRLARAVRDYLGTSAIGRHVAQIGSLFGFTDLE
jgi:HK97 gp10 family phage protein